MNIQDMQEIEAKQSSEINWDELYPRLLLYSLRLIKSNDLEDRVSAEDVALKAVERGMRYERKAPPIENFSSFVMRVARNIVIDEMRKERMAKRHFEEASTENDLPDKRRSVIRELEDKEFVEQILQSVNDDAELAEMVKILFDDPSLRSRELSEKMGVPLGKVYRLKKQLQKRLKDRLSDLAWKNNPIEQRLGS